MSMNLFVWIREGVRQAVLMGVSDAVETIGAPNDYDTFRDDLTKAIEPPTEGTAPRIGRSTPDRAARKRLGRSLKDVAPAPEQG